MQYERNDIAFERGQFRVRGDVVEIFPAASNDSIIRVEFFGDEVDRISEINPLTGELKAVLRHAAHKQFPWWIVCILEALIFGGVIAYLILKKRNDPPFDDDPIEDDEEEPEEAPEEALPDDLDERISKILSSDKPTEE